MGIVQVAMLTLAGIIFLAGLVVVVMVMVWALMGTPRQIFCRHGQWEPRGFSYIKCGKCGRSQYSPEKCSAMNSAFLSMMVDKGHWGKEATRAKALQHGIPFTE